MEVTAMEQCQGPGHNGEQCSKAAVRGGLCEGHRKQKRKKPDAALKPLAPRGQSFVEMLRAAALAYADAPAEDEAAFRRADKRLQVAALRQRRATTPGNEVPA